MTKLICIKDYFENYFGKYELICKKGDIYFGNDVMGYNCYDIYDEDDVHIGWVGVENFLTIAEWRSNQINSIIND